MGSTVTVIDAAGQTWVYRVVARAVYDQGHLPPDLFGATGPPRLVLLTCGGAFDPLTQQYSSNVTVYATPDGGR